MRRFLVALLLLTSLSGCRLFGGDSPLPIAIDSSIIDRMPRVSPSRRDTCETQKQIARQESYIQTIQAQKDVVVVARCGEAPKQVAAR